MKIHIYNLSLTGQARGLGSLGGLARSQKEEGEEDNFYLHLLVCESF